MPIAVNIECNLSLIDRNREIFRKELIDFEPLYLGIFPGSYAIQKSTGGNGFFVSLH